MMPNLRRSPHSFFRPRLCHEAGLVRLGLVALDGTKVGANAALDANRTASRVDEQVTRMLAEAEAADAQEDSQFGAQRGDELPAALARRSDRLARLQQCQDKLQRQAAEVAARQQGLVVTSVPKVPIWKACEFNALHRMWRDCRKIGGRNSFRYFDALGGPSIQV